jgi:lysophospholipase L1-like esterase
LFRERLTTVPARKKTSTRKKIAFSLLPSLIVLALGETAARVWVGFYASREQRLSYVLPSEDPEACKYRPHPYTCYALQPGRQRGGANHDSRGFRGSEVLVPKPPGVFRIAVLGGSTTYGEFIADDESAFPARTQHYLRNDQGRSEVEVVNAGVPGFNSWESMIDFQTRVLETEPDMVVVFFGVNDVHARLVDPYQYRADGVGRRRSWSDPWEVKVVRTSMLLRVIGVQMGMWKPPGVENYTVASSAYHRNRDAGPEMMDVLAANPPTHFRRNVENIVALAKARGIVPVLTTWPYSEEVKDYVSLPHYQRGVAELNAVIREVAAAENVPMFDLAAKMPTDMKYWRDGRHVNAVGADLEGRWLAEFMQANGLLIKDPRRRLSSSPALVLPPEREPVRR